MVTPLEPLADQFACKNTLADKVVVSEYHSHDIPFKWEAADIKKDFEKQVEKFDAIVGSPPWRAELTEQ